MKNNYPMIFTELCIKSFIINCIHLKLLFRMYLKVNVPCRSWEVFCFKLQRNLFTDKLMYYNLKIVFTSSRTVKWFFTFKDKLRRRLLSGLVYKYKCGGCSAPFYSKTKRYFKVQICEHLGISHLTGKKVKSDKNKLMAIQERLLCCNYSPSFEDFSILTRESNKFKLELMENLLIACGKSDKPVLNKADSSLPTKLLI